MAWPVDKVEVSVQRKCTLLKEKEKKVKELYSSRSGAGALIGDTVN